jgi:hypothetical protein
MTDGQIKLILEIISTSAIVAASIVAIYGINAWRKEFQGKRKIELAEEVLALFYEAKDAVSAIRNPLGYVGEGSSRKPQEGETPRQKEARDRTYVVYERYDKRKEVFNKLHSLRYQFMARFGVKEGKPFEDLRHILIEIQVAANMLAEIWSLDRRSEDTEKQRREHESIIWEHGRDDSIKIRLEKIISDMEAICKPIIFGKKID